VPEAAGRDAAVKLRGKDPYRSEVPFWSVGWWDDDGIWRGGAQQVLTTIQRLPRPEGEKDGAVRYTSSSSLGLAWNLETLTGRLCVAPAGGRAVAPASMAENLTGPGLRVFEQSRPYSQSAARGGGIVQQRAPGQLGPMFRLDPSAGTVVVSCGWPMGPGGSCRWPAPFHLRLAVEQIDRCLQEAGEAGTAR